MKAASSCRMAEITHALCFAEDFRPRHFIQLILERHRMGYEFKSFIQTAVRLDVQVFCILVCNIKQFLCIAVHRAAVIDFEFHAEMAQTLAMKKQGRAYSCIRG